jgi:hypothetical protein
MKPKAAFWRSTKMTCLYSICWAKESPKNEPLNCTAKSFMFSISMSPVRRRRIAVSSGERRAIIVRSSAATVGIGACERTRCRRRRLAIAAACDAIVDHAATARRRRLLQKTLLSAAMRRLLILLLQLLWSLISLLLLLLLRFGATFGDALQAGRDDEPFLQNETKHRLAL